MQRALRTGRRYSNTARAVPQLLSRRLHESRQLNQTPNTFSLPDIVFELDAVGNPYVRRYEDGGWSIPPPKIEMVESTWLRKPQKPKISHPNNGSQAKSIRLRIRKIKTTHLEKPTESLPNNSLDERSMLPRSVAVDAKNSKYPRNSTLQEVLSSPSESAHISDSDLAAKLYDSSTPLSFDNFESIITKLSQTYEGCRTLTGIEKEAQSVINRHLKRYQQTRVLNERIVYLIDNLTASFERHSIAVPEIYWFQALKIAASLGWLATVKRYLQIASEKGNETKKISLAGSIQYIGNHKSLPDPAWRAEALRLLTGYEENGIPKEGEIQEVSFEAWLSKRPRDSQVHRTHKYVHCLKKFGAGDAVKRLAEERPWLICKDSSGEKTILSDS